MRKFPYITVGKVLKELNKEIEKLFIEVNPDAKDIPQVTRVTFYRLEKRLGLPAGKKTSGGWRVYTPKQKEKIKQRIKEEYNLL